MFLEGINLNTNVTTTNGDNKNSNKSLHFRVLNIFHTMF